MDYTLTKSFDAAQRTRAEELLAWGTRENWSTTRMQEILQREGLGYRREVLIQDFEHARVVSRSTNPEALARAEWFYRNTYKPFKEENKLNTSQMGAVMSGFKREEEPTPDLENLIEQWDIWTEETGS